MERIRRIRGVDERHHLTLVCRDLSEIAAFAKVDNAQFRLLKRATPGSYTFILRATREVPRRLLHAARNTIGVRIPGHPVAHALLAELDEPMLSSTLILPGDGAAAERRRRDPRAPRARRSTSSSTRARAAPSRRRWSISPGDAPRVVREGKGSLRAVRRRVRLIRSAQHEDGRQLNLVQTIAIYALPVLFAITLHEAAHGYVARHFGDMTALRAGPRQPEPDASTSIRRHHRRAARADRALRRQVPVRLGEAGAGQLSALRNPKRDMVWVAAAGPGGQPRDGARLGAAAEARRSSCRAASPSDFLGLDGASPASWST